MKTVIIDNYDSFTYNLAHLVKELGAEVDVLRNDKFRLEELEPYDKIILSPGPGVPEEAGLSAGCHPHLCRTETHTWRLPGRTSHRTSVRRKAGQSGRGVPWGTDGDKEEGGRIKD